MPFQIALVTYKNMFPPRFEIRVSLWNGYKKLRHFSERLFSLNGMVPRSDCEIKFQSDFFGMGINSFKHVRRRLPFVYLPPKLQTIQVFIMCPLGKKFLVGAHFDDFSFGQHDDFMCVPNGRKPMRDHKGRSSSHQTV